MIEEDKDSGNNRLLFANNLAKRVLVQAMQINSSLTSFFDHKEPNDYFDSSIFYEYKNLKNQNNSEEVF